MAETITYPGVSTLEMALNYFADSTTRPSSGDGTTLGRINGIGEISVSTEAIDASALEDKSTKRIAGRDDVSETWEITVNVTNETLAAWQSIKGQTKWFRAKPNANLSYAYWVRATVPNTLPLSGADQNALLTMAITLVVVDTDGWVSTTGA